MTTKNEKTPGVEAWPSEIETVGFLLRRAYQYNMTLFQRYCFDDQLTSVQLAALFALSRQEPCSLTDIGQIASIDPSTTRGVVDRLERRALIVSEQDVEDRRRMLVRLTESGRAIVRDMMPVVDRLSEEMLARFTPGDRVALHYLLKKLLPEPE